MRILIAPNAFKNSLDAKAVAMAIKEGLQQSKLECTCECFPVGDGGDGTAELIINKCEGTTVH
ncbi:MAG: glycerate kinase, partial [Ginsengibacter sp.]